MIPERRSRDFRAIHEPIEPAVVTGGRLLIDLAGTTVAVKSESDSWLSEVCDRYGPFVRQDAVADLTIVHTVDESTMMERHGCLSVLEPDLSGARIAGATGTSILDGVMRTLMPSVMAPDLMVHGALLSDGRRGFLCCGVSGSGKSTMASLLTTHAVCDELARVHAGPNGVEARSLPFWEARPWTGVLAAIFFIEHGADHRRTSLGSVEGVQRLRRHVYWPAEDPQLTVGAFETLSKACETTPVFNLAFRPDPSVWSTMTEGF